jgi:4-hydroxy-tetrahydrodipicolinate synthase
MRQGLFTALITPFKNEGSELDLDAFRKLVQRQVDAKVEGIVLMGTTGESATVTLNERKQLIKEAKKITQGKVLLMAGCGTNDTLSTIEQAKISEEAGAEALQIVTPPYSKPSQEGLYLHFKAIHDSVQLPIFIYNIPGRTSVNMDVATIKRLFALERMAGIKEASGNMQQLVDVIETLKGRPCTILAGDDSLALPAIALGAHGVMSVLGNLLPKKMKALVDAALMNDLQKARSLHYELKSIMQACFVETNPVPIKYMLGKVLSLNDTVRLPLAPLTEKSRSLIDTTLSKNVNDDL